MNNFYEQDSWLKFNTASIKLLVGMLALLIALATTYAWFTDSDHHSSYTDTGNIYIELHTTMDNIYMVTPNETISKEYMVYIVGKPTTADAYVRVKYTAFIGENEVTQYIQPILYFNAEYALQNEDTWVYSDKDHRYYYVGYTNSDEIVVFCNGFKVREDFPKAFANKTVIFTIVADSIQRNFRAYETDPLWQDQYPEAWATMLDKYNFNVDQTPIETAPAE